MNPLYIIYIALKFRPEISARHLQFRYLKMAIDEWDIMRYSCWYTAIECHGNIQMNEFNE